MDTKRLEELERILYALINYLGLEVDYVPDYYKVFDPKEDDEEQE